MLWRQALVAAVMGPVSAPKAVVCVLSMHTILCIDGLTCKGVCKQTAVMLWRQALAFTAVALGCGLEAIAAR